MTSNFGIHPWDIEKMTYEEIRFYEEALMDLAKEQRKQKQ